MRSWRRSSAGGAYQTLPRRYWKTVGYDETDFIGILQKSCHSFPRMQRDHNDGPAWRFTAQMYNGDGALSAPVPLPRLPLTSGSDRL